MATTRWLGYVQGTNRGKVFVRIKSSNKALTGDIVFKDIAYGTAAARIKGRLTNSQIAADLFDFVFAKPLPIEPQAGQISMTISKDGSEVSGAWATDIGTNGQYHLFKISSLRALFVFVPFFRTVLLIKRGFIANLRYLYLVFSLIVMIASATGVLKEKIGLTETIILIIPLIFLFRNEIKNFFITTGLKKIGPVEFQEQSVVPVGISQETINSFVREYGDQFSYFVILNQFFVLRTKTILRMLAAQPFSVSREYFNRLARMLGIEENNIQVTYDVLIQHRCLAIDQDGKISISDTGRKFLEFEDRFNQLFPSR